MSEKPFDLENGVKFQLEQMLVSDLKMIFLNTLNNRPESIRYKKPVLANVEKAPLQLWRCFIAF